jgi:hypothetical protein
MGEEMEELFVQAVPLIIFQAAFLFVIVPLSRRVSPNHYGWWIIFAIVPAFGALAYVVLFGKALAVILDKLDRLAAPKPD